MNIYIYIYINSVHIIHIHIIKFVIYILNSKRIIEPATEELINKTQLFSKIISMSSHWLGGSTKESHFTYSIVVHMLPRTKVRDHHMYQPHDTKIVRVSLL